MGRSRADYRQWITVEVRWGDMDAFGHVNNAKYFTYCESARIAYFEAVGLVAHREAEGEAPAVVTATCNFLAQVHYPATLEVGVRTVKIGRSSFTLEYGIFRSGTETRVAADRVADDLVADDLVADGSSVVVWVDYGAGRSAPLPEDLKRRIREIDGLKS